jgi:2-iminoacetate synthase
MDDSDLTQLICAYRLWNEFRNLPVDPWKWKFRDNIIPIGITSMSAGSKTNPGGYVVDPQSWNNLKSVTNDRLQRLQKSFPVKDMNPFERLG